LEDPVGAAALTTDRFIDLIAKMGEKDSAVFECLAAAQEAQAAAAERHAKAALVKEAREAAVVFIQAQKDCVELPAGLLAMISGNL
jgi:hypothetical protein